MVFFYYLLLWILWFFAAILLLILSFSKTKYKNALKARFFLYKNLHQEKAQVHFHTCSLGETRSIKDLAKHFDSRISVITQTGFDEAKTFCKKVNFLAFEIFLPFWLKPCSVLVLFEAEYWLMLVFMAKLKGAKVLLINARIAEKSYKKYKRFAFFYRKIFSYIDEVFAQSNEDKERLEALGARSVVVFENIKLHNEICVSRKYSKLKQKLIIFASTHKAEEELLLENFSLKEDEKLIIAPRHPERFLELEKLLIEKKLEFNKFSSLNLKENDLNYEFKAQILLLDALGELVNFYAISDVVVLGGSFIPNIGGHNPIEAAFFNNSIISGKFIDNQKALFSQVENIIFCENISALDEKIHNIKDKASIKQKKDLNQLIKAIKEGIDARKSI